MGNAVVPLLSDSQVSVTNKGRSEMACLRAFFQTLIFPLINLPQVRICEAENLTIDLIGHSLSGQVSGRTFK
jgi:hypothetical protein